MILAISDVLYSYFRAYRNYERGGGPAPEPWRITFDEAAHGDAHAGQDVLLASNAHHQHDLPLAYAEMGLNTPAGGLRKHDHDARERDQHTPVRRARGRVHRPLTTPASR